MKNILYIIAIVFVMNIASAEDYFYDDAGRLIEVAYDNGYYVTYKYDNNGNIISQTVSMESSLKEDIEQVVDLRSYPNPAGSAFTVSFNLEEASTVTIKIYDSKGSLVNEVPAGTLNQGKHEFEINTTDATGAELSSGSYMISLVMENKQQTLTVDHEMIIQK